MRLRLYPCSERVRDAPVIIDRFPAILSVPHEWAAAGRSDGGLSDWCQLKLHAGAVYLIDRHPELATLRNGTAVPREQQHVTPLLPGERILFDGFEFIVSYERVTRLRSELLERQSRDRIDGPHQVLEAASTSAEFTPAGTFSG